MDDDATEYMIDQLYQSMAVQDAEIKRLRGNVETGNKMIVEQASEVARLKAEIQWLRGEIAKHKAAVMQDAIGIEPELRGNWYDTELWALIEEEADNE